MSGICGMCQPGATPSPERLAAMLGTLSVPHGVEHRSLCDRSIALGVAQGWSHQQLAQTLSVHIAVDADLLNLGELVQFIQKRDTQLPVGSLAEIIASSYILRGKEFLGLLRGTFSIALWDQSAGRLLLAIDRLGIQNLYWATEKEGLLFSSRSSAIVAAQRRSAEVNHSALVQFLIFGTVTAPLSIYKGVERLRPGHLLIFEHGRLQQRRYWDVEYAESPRGNVRHWAREVRRSLREAVRVTTDACRPETTGAYLSGGTDSSTVVAFLNEWHSPANTFSVWFDDPRYSEMGYARTTAETFHTHHFERCLSPDDALEAIPKIVEYYDEPFANSSALGAYWCARMAQEEGMHTLFAGDGGDELFAGNERYASDKIFQLYNLLPSGLRRGAIEPLLDRLPASNPLTRFVRRARIPNPRRMLSRQLFLSMDPAEVFDPTFLSSAAPDHWLDIPEAHFAKAPAHSELNRMLYLDLKITLADNDLRKVVGTAEMVGIRVRFPLLDHHLVQFSGTVPSGLKMKGWQKRYIFKQAMAGLLPNRILYKKKHGFGVPIGRWLLEHAGLKSLINDVLHDSKTRQRGYFLPSFLDRLLELHRAGHASYYGEVLWYVFILECWHRQHLERSLEVVSVAN